MQGQTDRDARDAARLLRAAIARGLPADDAVRRVAVFLLFRQADAIVGPRRRRPNSSEGGTT